MSYKETLDEIRKKYGFSESGSETSEYKSEGSQQEDAYHATLNSILEKYSRPSAGADRFNSMISDYNRFLEDTKKDYDMVDWGNSGELSEKNISRISELGSSAKDLFQYYFTGEGRDEAFSAQNRGQLQEIMNNLRDMDSDWKNTGDYYRQWEDEDSWNEYKKITGLQEKYNWHTAPELETALEGMPAGEDKDYLGILYNALYQSEQQKNGWLDREAPYNQNAVSARQGYYSRNQERIRQIEEQIRQLQTGEAEPQPVWEMLGNAAQNAALGISGGPEIRGKNQDEIANLEREKENLETQNRQYEYIQKIADEKYGLTQEAGFGESKRDYALPTGQEGELIDRLGLYHTASDDPDIYGHLYPQNNGASDPWNNQESGLRVAQKYGNGYLTVEDAVRRGVENDWNQLTDTEIEVYYYLLQNQGQEAADKYLDDMSSTLGYRATKAETEAIENAGTGEKILYNVASVPANVLGGPMAFTDDAARLLQGKEINPYSRGHALTNFATKVRSSTAEGIVEKIGSDTAFQKTVGQLAANTYQGIMSGVDSAVGAMTMGPGYTVAMGMGAASQRAKELYEGGATKEQMIVGSLGSGILEGLFEYVSIDKFTKNFMDQPIAGWKDFVKKTLAQGGVEASEEVNTELANMLWDALVMGAGSEDNQQIYKLMENGLTQEQAKKQVILQNAQDVFWAAYSGFVSGGGMGTVGASIKEAGMAPVYKDYKQTYGDQAQALVDEAAELDPQSKITQNAQKTLQNGKVLSGRQIYNLVNSNEQAIAAQDKAAIQTAAQNRLTELGETGDVAKISAALAKQAAGEQLNRSERRAIQFSHYGAQVAAELNPETKFKDGKAPEWVGKIGTQRLNAGIYNRAAQDTQTPQKAEPVRNVSVPQEAKNPAQAVTADAVEPISTETFYTVSDSGETTQLSTGETVQIQEVAEAGEDGMKLRTEDGSLVDADDIGYASREDALLYESVADLGADAPAANALIRTYKEHPGNVPVQDYVPGAAVAFQAGMRNDPISQLAQDPLASKLTGTQRNAAYAAGRNYARRASTAKEESIKQSDGKTSKNTKSDGKVHLDRKGRTFSEAQETGIKTMEILSKAIGTEFYVFESYEKDGARVYRDENGKEKPAPNGFYDPKTGAIHIDLNAGSGGRGTVLFTVAHELTHFIRQWSPAKFDTLADAVISMVYGQKNINVKERIQAQQAKAQQAGITLTEDEAYEEMIADSMETILRDGNVLNDLMEMIQQKDATLWEKIKQWFRDLAENIRRIMDAYKGYDPDSYEGRAVASMEGYLEILEGFYVDALSTAGENYRESENKDGLSSNKESFQVRADNESRVMDYSYESLISKPDMRITNVSGYVPENRTDVIRYAKQNAAKVGSFNEKDGSVSVHVKDINTDVILSTNGLKHGLDRRFSNNAAVTLKAGEILKNSIQINELTPSRTDAEESYVLIGAARTDNGEYYIVQSVVNKFSNELKTMDVLYSLNAKKGNQLRSMRPGFQGPVTDSTISIAELLDNVKEYFPDVLPEAVLRHFGFKERPEGKLGESALYSLRDTVQEKAVKSLQKENDRLKEDISRLKELVKLQGKLTYGKMFSESYIEDTARSLKKLADAKGDTRELAGLLRKMYTDIANGPEINLDRLEAAAKPVVDWLWGKKQSHMDPYAESILNAMKGRKVTISPQQAGDMFSTFESIQEYKKRLSGTVRVVPTGTEGAMDLDSFWQEMADAYPGTFDAEISDAGMAVALAEIVGRLQSMTFKDYEQESPEVQDAMRQELFYGVYETFWQAKTTQTVADKKQKEIDSLKEKHERQMERRTAQVDRKQREIDSLKEKHEQQIRDLKKDHKETVSQLKKAKADSLKELRENTRKSQEVKKYRRSIEKKAKKLMDALAKNSDKEHIPEALKSVVGDFLNSINFSSKSLMEKGTPTKRDESYTEALGRLQEVLQKQENLVNGVEDSNLLNDFYMDLPTGFAQAVQEHIKKVTSAAKGLDTDTNQVFAMGAEELQDLDYILTVITKSVSQMNKLLANAHFQTAAEAAQTSVREFKELGKDKSRGKAAGGAYRFLQWHNATPFYVFKRMGEGAQSVFEGLQDGWDRLAFNAQAIIDFAEETYTAKEVKDWTEDVKTVELSSGEKIRLTTAQLMSIYCLSHRKQGMQHLLGGGIRVGDFEIKQKTGKAQVSDAENYTLTIGDIAALNDLLSDRQKAVADKLQKYMNTVGTKWGNEVSMKRFGYQAFTEENYFPIQSDSNNRQTLNTDTQNANNLYRLLNLSMTKSLTPKANNAVVIGSVFDVFADHMSDMAKYNALALPVLDAMKWYNYKTQTKNENGQVDAVAVKKSMESAFGKSANSYFMNLIKDINGTNEGGKGTDRLSRKMISNYKVAAVAGNLRVALLQPTAYVRATAVLSPKYLIRGVAVNPVTAAQEAEKYSGIAAWKSMGFYDTGIARGIREQIKHDTGVKDMLVEKSMKAAEWGDRLTWGVLWNACKQEVQDTRHLTGDALMEATSKRFRDVVYRTQVVDSTMTRSQSMRDTGGLSVFTTAFMAEPTLSYNMLLDAYSDYANEVRRTGDKGAAWGKAKNVVIRTLVSYTLTNLAAALAEGLMDAWRDDDEYETFLEKFLEHFKDSFRDDMNPLTKLPVVKDVLSYLDGYDNSRMDTEWLKNLADVYSIWAETIALKTGAQEKATSVTYNGNMPLYGKLYKTLKAMSQAVGMPFSNTMREIASFWNNTFGVITGKKLRTYDPGPASQIKYAYLDGFLTQEEATQELLKLGPDDGGAKNADDAYFKIQSWETNKGKYTALDTALQQDQSIDAAVEDLTSHGIKPEEIQSHIKSTVGGWYKDNAISRDQATAMLKKNTDLDSTVVVAKWDWDIQYPEYADLSEAAASGFHSAGVSAEVYYDACKFLANATGDKDANGNTISGSKKEKVMKYIASLNISSSQKDSLWNAIKGSWKGSWR